MHTHTPLMPALHPAHAEISLNMLHPDSLQCVPSNPVCTPVVLHHANNDEAKQSPCWNKLLKADHGRVRT